MLAVALREARTTMVVVVLRLIAQQFRIYRYESVMR